MCQPAGPEAPAYMYVRVCTRRSQSQSCLVLCRSQAWLQICKSGERPWRCDEFCRGDPITASVCLPPRVSIQSSPIQWSRASINTDTIRYCYPHLPASQSRKLLDARTNESRRLRSYKSNGPKQRCIRSAERLRKRHAPCQQSRKHGCSFTSEPLRRRRSAAPAELAVGTAASHARLSVERLPCTIRALVVLVHGQL